MTITNVQRVVSQTPTSVLRHLVQALNKELAQSMQSYAVGNLSDLGKLEMVNAASAEIYRRECQDAFLDN